MVQTLGINSDQATVLYHPYSSPAAFRRLPDFFFHTNSAFSPLPSLPIIAKFAKFIGLQQTVVF